MDTRSRIPSIERATKRTWDEWLKFMDGIGAKRLDHHAIASKVLEELDGVIDSPGWWAQSVTVAYEQHIGRRMPGQNSDGTFQASLSRSTKHNMKELMDRWLSFATVNGEAKHEIKGDVRAGGTEKRLTWRARTIDDLSITITSEPKKDGSASIVATLVGARTHDLNAKARLKWSSIVKHFIETSCH